MALFGFTQKILKNQPIDVYNNGDMQRDFTYIDDIVQGVVAALEKVSNKSHEVYNLGNNTPVKLLDFITTLEKTIGKEARKNFKPRQPGDVLTTYADITKAQKDLGYIPKTELAEGIGNFYQWYKEYYKIK
jgi:UDP-glucuronate 4-epimerase